MTDVMEAEKLGYGRLRCPHQGCDVVRQGADAMSEHMDSVHGKPRSVSGAEPEILPGTDLAPEELASDIDAMMQSVNAPDEQWRPTEEEEMRIRHYASRLYSWKGKKMPEFIVMWDRTNTPRRVASRRMAELIFSKGFRLRPPTKEQYDKTWFHWQCPIPTCKDHTNWCEVHKERGSDSNHPLRSPDYMIIQHLQSGGKLHKQYYAMNEDDLKEKYRSAFLAFQTHLEEQAKASERSHDDQQRQLKEEAGR